MTDKVISLNALVVTKVKTNWFIGRVHGAVFFARSRSEVYLKHRRWNIQRLENHDKQHLEALTAVRRVSDFRGRAC